MISDSIATSTESICILPAAALYIEFIAAAEPELLVDPPHALTVSIANKENIIPGEFESFIQII
jgi:hypothetical protein